MVYFATREEFIVTLFRDQQSTGLNPKLCKILLGLQLVNCCCLLPSFCLAFIRQDLTTVNCMHTHD